MRGALIVIGTCLVLSTIVAWFVHKQFRTGLVASQDLTLGLIYFMEQHDGRFPASQAEFLASDFIEKLPAGAIRIHAPAHTRYRRETHGYPIADLAPFEIRWGTDLSKLKVDDYQNLLDAEGNKVALVRWPDSPPSGKGYSMILMRASGEIRAHAASEAAATQPAASPAPASMP